MIFFLIALLCTSVSLFSSQQTREITMFLREAENHYKQQLANHTPDCEQFAAAAQRYIQCHALLDSQAPNGSRQLDRSPPCLSTPDTEYSLEQIIALLKQDAVMMQHRPNSYEITGKRIVFRTLVELFSSFGKARLDLQQPQTEKREEVRAAVESLTDAGKKIGTKIKNVFVDRRWYFVLRTLRIFANMAINETIPNPHAEKWQRFAELLLPAIFGHSIATVVSYSTDGNDLQNFLSTVISDCMIRLFTVNFFLEEGSKTANTMTVVSRVLPFYLCDTSQQLWDKHADHDKNFVHKRASFVYSTLLSKKHSAAVGIEGLADILIYTIIDDIIEKVGLPACMKYKPVTLQHSSEHCSCHLSGNKGNQNNANTHGISQTTTS